MTRTQILQLILMVSLTLFSSLLSHAEANDIETKDLPINTMEQEEQEMCNYARDSIVSCKIYGIIPLQASQAEDLLYIIKGSFGALTMVLLGLIGVFLSIIAFVRKKSSLYKPSMIFMLFFLISLIIRSSPCLIFLIFTPAGEHYSYLSGWVSTRFLF